jgi:hypothetical protein
MSMFIYDVDLILKPLTQNSNATCSLESTIKHISFEVNNGEVEWQLLLKSVKEQISGSIH